MFEQEILDVYRKSETRTFPVDCEKILRAYGYKVKTYIEESKSTRQLKSLRAYSSDAFTDSDRKTIYYNDDLSHRRICFSLMHELGHVVLQTDDDSLADAFAGNILAPRPIIYARNHSGNRSRSGQNQSNATRL